MKRVYQCDFCSTTDADKGVMKEHEAGCLDNPSLKSCFTCKHALHDGWELDKYLSLIGCEKQGADGWLEFSEDELDRDYNDDDPFELPELPEQPIVSCPHWEDADEERDIIKTAKRLKAGLLL